MMPAPSVLMKIPDLVGADNNVEAYHGGKKNCNRIYFLALWGWAVLF
jgi:hypothetical protein